MADKSHQCAKHVCDLALATAYTMSHSISCNSEILDIVREFFDAPLPIAIADERKFGEFVWLHVAIEAHGAISSRHLQNSAARGKAQAAAASTSH